MKLVKPLPGEVMEVLGNVWQAQAPEIVASMREQEGLTGYAERLLKDSVISHVWVDADGYPYAVGGWILTGRHEACSWLFHTPTGLDKAPAIIRIIRRTMRNMKSAGVHRFEAVTIENEATERWYRAFGMHRERYLDNWGTNGETMALYVNERN